MNILRRKNSGMGNTGKSGASAGAPGRAMSRLAKSFALFLSFAGLLLGATNANAAACASLATGNWGTIGTWSCGHVPVAIDTVTITAGHTVTVDTAAVASAVTVGSTTAVNTLLTISGTNSLTVSGLVSMPRPGNPGGTNNIVVGAGTLSAGSLTMSATTGAVRTNTLSISTGSATISGTTTTSGVASQFTFTGAGTLTFGGTVTLTGAPTLTTFAGSTVIYSRAGAQTGIVGAYSNLTLAGSGAKTFANFTAPSSVNGVLSMEGTATVTVTTGAVTYGANATLQYNTATARTATVEEWIPTFAASGGVIIVNTGAITMGAAKVFNAGIPLTINAGATLTPAASLLTLGGDFNNLGTFTSGSGGVTIAGAAATQSIDGFTTTGTVSMTKTAGTATLTGNVNGGAFTLSGLGGTLDLGVGLTHTFTGAWTRTNGALLGNSSILNIGGSTTNTAGTFTAGTSTVNYTGAAQTIANVAYYNLGFSGSLAKTMGATTISNDFTMSGTATTAPTGALAVGGNFTIGATNTFTAGALAHSVGGNWNNSGTFTAGTSTVTFNGTAQQTLTGATTFNNMTVNNAAGLVLANDITATSAAAGVVTLTSGTVTTGANTLIIPRSCATPSVTRTGGWVNGNLRKAIPAGASTCNFEVGDAANYTPVSTTFVAGTTAGNLTVTTVGTQHPSITDPSSDLNTAKMVNRYWTLTNGGVGLPVAGYSATFTFINPGDLTGGSTPANFEVENWSGVAWLATTAGTRTASSTQANSLTAFGAFAVGEKKLPIVVSINCSVPSCPATSAATVSWAVTFSKSVTGVDATDFTLAATGVSGAYITAVSGSGTSWTVTANTGIGSGTLGLNLVDDDTIIDAGGGKLGGAGAGNGNFTGEVYPITAAPALAEYRMDEASWNGTANEVADSSGSANHAQAFNGASTTGVAGQEAKPGNPGTCRYGNFNGGYVQTPLPNLTTDFTITAWIRTTDNTQVGQRILIDDEGTAPATGYGFSFNDAGTGVLRFFSRGITSLVILDSTYPIANNTWYFVAAVADITSKKRTIYVFNAAGTLLNSTTEAAWASGTWGTDGGPVSIGGETIASGESALHFVGNLDEVRVYQKVLGQNALTAIATQSHACPILIPDHLEIHSSGSGLTCAASTLTIKACTDAAIPCAIPYTLGVSGTLSATGAPTVNWDGTTGGAAGAGFAIPNGGSSVTKDVQVATAGTVTFGVAAATPAPTNATACNFGTNPGNNNCVFTANTAGFIFSDSATGNTAYTIPALTSGTAQNTDNLLWLRAVQASTANAAVCTPTIISQTVAVNMGYTCNNPAACQAGNLGVINGTAIAPAGTPVSLAFDANGSAKITSVRYDDVGEITLTANKTITPFGGGTAVTLNGNSNAFVVKPAGFVISGIKCSTIDAANCGAGALAMATPGDNPAAVDAAGVTFIRAGHPFTATVTAKNALGNTTKNYGQESTAESVKLTPALAGGLGLTNNPAVSGAFGTFTDGVATGTTFIWKEAGIIKLTPSVGDGDYLGAGDASGTQSGNIGRFYAAKFALTPSPIANRTDICPAPVGCGDAFTYMGEQMSAVFNLNAQAVDGTTTLQNYNYAAVPANNFAKLDPTAAGNPLALAAVDTGSPRTVATLDTTTYGVASGNFVSGVASVTAPFAVTRGASAFGPFDALDVGVKPADSDGATLAMLNLAVNAGGSPDTHGKIGTTKARYGRMKLSNAHGSELLNLPIPMEVQYWQGQYWAQNNLDDATAIVQNNIKLSNAAVTISGVIKDAAGKWRIVLNKPLTPVSSSVCLDLDVGATGDMTCVATTPLSMPYLQTGAAFDKDPVSRATFGVYKGNNEFIYLREAY